MFLNIILFALTIVLKGEFTLKLSTSENGTDYVNGIKDICSSAPISNLNLCSNKCLDCSASNNGKCATCNSQYVLSSQECVIDNSVHNYS